MLEEQKMTTLHARRAKDDSLHAVMPDYHQQHNMINHISLFSSQQISSLLRTSIPVMFCKQRTCMENAHYVYYLHERHCPEPVVKEAFMHLW